MAKVGSAFCRGDAPARRQVSEEAGTTSTPWQPDFGAIAANLDKWLMPPQTSRRRPSV